MDDLRAQLQSSLGSAYAIERELAGGGMSRVFLAEERALGRRVVIKVLPADLAAAVSIERFKREIALAARLQHPHIVPLLTAGESDGLPYFTMPFVDGESLRLRLASQGELPVSEAVRMLREIASALSYAHEHSVVHRDIKPDNILLSGGATMVTDFGVAKALVASSTLELGGITSEGVALGTPAYMAPEQVAADPAIDHRADVYAFGVLAYEVLTGQPPFTGRTPQGLLAANLCELAEPITKRRRSIPPALAALVMCCLEKRPSDRPQSAAEIVRLLDGIAVSSGGMQAASGSGFMPGISASPARRWRWAVAAVAAIVVVALALMMWRQKTPRQPLLAVLPFENLGQADEEYFADGLTEEISSRLEKVSGLKIIGRSSAQQYKRTTKTPREIGLDLDVDYVLTGSVRFERPANGTSVVRVNPHLIRTEDATSAWADSYEGPLIDVFKFQSTVAEGVAQAMHVALPAPERRALTGIPTRNPVAYVAYLRGLASSSRGRLFESEARQTSIAELRRATALDPAFAAAHARLALAYVNAARYGGEHKALDDAALHLESAMSLDSASSDTRLARAWYLFERKDLQNSLAVVQALLRASPANSQAMYLEGLIDEGLDRPDEAIASYTRAQALEPTSPDPPAALASLYDALGRHAEAVQSREREISFTPDNVAAYFAQAVSHLLWRYDTTEARRVLERGIAATSLGRMSVLPRTWILDWTRALPPGLRSALDTLSRAGAAATLPGLRFDEVKLTYLALSGQTERARVYADSVVRLLEPGRSAGDPERGLLLAGAYMTLGRTKDAQREADAAFPLVSRAEPRRRIPAVVTSAYIAMATGRSDVALERLATVTALRSGFYISQALLRADRVWAPLRAHPRFEEVVATAK